MIRVKICGITNIEDALYASHLGAYAVGFVFFEGSKRYVSPETAKNIIKELPPFLVKVGVFVNEKPDTISKLSEYVGLDRIQLHTDFPHKYENFFPQQIIMAYRIKSQEDVELANNSKFFPLLDRYDEKEYGGTGKTFDWSLLKGLKRDYILAGGINIENIDKAVALNPYAIDISSGIEQHYGKKDHKKMFEIFEKLRENQKI